jgi:hypothetical protein
MPRFGRSKGSGFVAICTNALIIQTKTANSSCKGEQQKGVYQLTKEQKKEQKTNKSPIEAEVEDTHRSLCISRAQSYLHHITPFFSLGLRDSTTRAWGNIARILWCRSLSRSSLGTLTLTTLLPSKPLRVTVCPSEAHSTRAPATHRWRL